MDDPTEVVPLEDLIHREELVWFASKMDEQLSDNDHKGHWCDEKPSYLLYKLIAELAELTETLHENMSDWANQKYTRDAIVSECADLANYAMMIADNAK